jgi:hypothetical protein
VDILGWRSWLQGRPEGLPFGVICSLVAFVFASLSASLEIGTGLYARFTNIPFMDPVLLRIYRVGMMTAVLGLVSSLPGMGTKNPLRWKAPALSAALLLLWFGQATGE